VGEGGRKGDQQGICNGRHRLRQGGYVVTSHPSQGQTVDKVLIRADTELGAKDLINNRMTYVAVSHGAYDAQIDC
jgi:ATP-dependent exoDNAse (exonuclease V) alpha subunit